MSNEPLLVFVEPDLQDLIPIFFEQRCKDQAAIAHALQVGDFEALRKIGHGMTGGGRSYGFSAITEIGEAMERASGAHDLEELRRLSAQLADYMSRLTVKYL